MVPITGNTYPIKDQLKALGGKWSLDSKCWMVPASHAAQAQAIVPAAKAPAQKRMVGDVSGILALFAKARTHLKFPAIELSVPPVGTRPLYTFTDKAERDAEKAKRRLDPVVCVNVATHKAKEPGSLTLLSGEKGDDGRRRWLGRISLDGSCRSDDAALVARLRQFAADPAGIAGEHGELHGRCCFCRKALTDKRSTAVGYGETCANNFGLPWGAKPTEFAGQA
jgi:hypothetical protein